MRFCSAPNCSRPVFSTDKITGKGYQARLEWNEKGGVDLIADEAGVWTVAKFPITKYFESSVKTGFDVYGNPENK